MLILFENGADVDAKDNEGRTALFWAASNGRVEVVKVLIENGANVDVKDENGKTALHWAALYGHFDVANFLIEKGADVDAKNIYSKTALHWAAFTIISILSAKPLCAFIRHSHKFIHIHT